MELILTSYVTNASKFNKTTQCISLEVSLIIYVKQTKYLMCKNISGMIHKNLIMVVTSERGILKEKQGELIFIVLFNG